MKLPIYLDYSATTPVDPRVAEKMMQFMTMDGTFGNPASRSHRFGWQAEEAVDIARNQIADLVGADPREIVFTSGATESDNLAIKGAANFYQKKGKHIITSKTEHKAVLDTCRQLEREGFEVTYLAPQRNGIIDLKELEAAMRDDTILVSIMHVNNEIGVVQDIAAIGEMCRARGIIYHVDATQSVGKLPIDLSQLKVDLMSFSGHKIYGPKGIGALYVRRKPRVRIEAQMHGGGHERGMRSGTLPVHQIVGMGEAYRIAKEEMATEMERLRGLRNRLWNGIKDIEEANAICEAHGLDPYKTCEETQPICFENAKWAYVVGTAIALKKNCTNAAEAAEAIGIGLQAFCIPGSVADDRKVGIGHGNLAAMLLREETKCFAFLAGHESFAAAEGAIKIAAKADKVRKEPLRCILNGLGKDAAQIISRINGFTYVQTQFDYFTGELKVVREIAYSDGPRAKVKCYGADDVREGVAIMWKEGVDVSITGNSTNPTRFQHPVAGTYKKERVLAGKPYFSVASGGGTGRTLHPDNMAAGPASYGMTDTMGRMHSDAQFAGSSSVPAHVEMMGFLGIGNNPMVGCTVACAVDVAQALGK